VNEALLWLRALGALATIATFLVALRFVLHRLQRGGGLFSRRPRLIEHVETLPLGNASAIHVIRIAGRMYAVGAAQAQLSVLCELPPSFDCARSAKLSSLRSG